MAIKVWSLFEKFKLSELNNNFAELDKKIADMKAFVGYDDDDVYGVEVDFVNKKFTRLAGAVNRSAGSGFDGTNAFGGRKRCNLDNSGNVIAYYGDAGFSTTGKLTQAVTVGGTTYASGTIVQVMVEQPKFYYKVVPLLVEKKAKGSIARKIRYYVSDTAKAGFKLHPAFIVNGQENEKIYVSAFEGSLWDASASTYILDDSQVADFTADMLSSIANAKPMSGLTQNLVRSNVRKLAEKRGTGWEQATVQTAAASELLMLIEYASFNMQSAIGQGAVNKTDDRSSNMAENTGVTITLGNASGTASNANGVQFVTYRGEENFWGNIWGWVDGINHYANATTGECDTYIADHGFVDDSSATPYVNAGISAKYGNGYVSAFCYAEEFDWLFIAGEVVGDSSLPVGDYFWNQNGTGWRVAQLGAYWGNGLAAGAFCWHLYDASSTRTRYIGGRLVYVPYAISSHYNGVAHNAIYRGKYLGTSVTAAQYAAISAGTFEDLYIGDYWTIGGRNYRIAAFDYYWNCGNASFNTHHAVIVPEKSLYNAVMNTTDTTTGGYVDSKMRTENLAQAKTIIKTAFSGHVKSHRIFLVNAVTNGYSSFSVWRDSEVDLMNEQMVYGSGIFSPVSTGSDSAISSNSSVEKNQLPLFAMNPAMLNIRDGYWLRDVISASRFASVDGFGNATHYGASSSFGVRPAFCIS